MLLVRKPHDGLTLQSTKVVLKFARSFRVFCYEGLLVDSNREGSSHLKRAYAELDVVAEPDLCQEIGDRALSTCSEGALQDVDLVICLGGDGTVLHASSLFAQGAVPPVIGLSLGSLGFLMPFRACAPLPVASVQRFNVE